jgi:hypothetical protein
LSLLLLVAACGGEPATDTRAQATGQPVVPDTATVDGVLQMRHDSTAFDRAPQLRLAAEPTVVFSDGGDPEFDLTRAQVTLLPDGRLVAVHSLGGGRVMVLGADGTPVRMLARSGEGPGEVIAPSAAVHVGGDTVLVTDAATRRASWFSVNDGFLRTERVTATVSPTCIPVLGVLKDGRSISVERCSSSVMAPDGTFERTVALTASAPDYSRIDTLAVVASVAMELFEIHSGGRTIARPTWVRYGRIPTATAWQGMPTNGASDRGYLIERRDLAGAVVAVIEVTGVARPVTPAMRDTLIALEIAQARQYAEAGALQEAEREAREAPIADTLPPFLRIIGGADGLLWVQDYTTVFDSTWSATAFRPDGAIVGRLSGPRPAWPVAFTGQGVLMREEDADGVVRFALYPLVAAGE